MQELNNKTHSDNEIDLSEIFDVLWKGKWIIVSLTAFVSVLAVIYSLLLPNIYESKAVLTPADSSNSISRSLQNYAGLAGLAGINLNTASDESNSAQAMQKLRSLSFFENNILPNIFLPDLMALKSWDLRTNTLNYDKRIYDEKTKTWVRDYSHPSTQIPSAQESFKIFRTE